MRIALAVIQQARQTDLPSYLLARGEPLTKKGNEYRHGIHNSLVIKGNTYFWNSKQTGGSSLDFMMDFYGMTFQQAVEELTGEHSKAVTPCIPVPNEPKVLVMPDKGVNINRLYAYLTQTRNISKDVLQLCLNRHLIYQDNHGNVVFRMKDITGEVVGAEIIGTSTQRRYKGIASGSKHGYGFNIVLGAKCERMIVFESSIDLLSFITLQSIDRVNNRLLVSMAGLKDQTLLNMAKEHSIPLDKVCCCVDRDNAGIHFAEEMRSQYGTNIYLPPNELGIKDWNDLVKHGK